MVPGVLLTEAMAQTSGWLIAASTAFRRWPLLALIRNAKFRKPVAPDAQIDIEATVRAERGDVVETMARADVEGIRVASASLVFHLHDLSAVVGAPTERWVHDTFARLNGPRALSR